MEYIICLEQKATWLLFFLFWNDWLRAFVLHRINETKPESFQLSCYNCGCPIKEKNGHIEEMFQSSSFLAIRFVPFPCKPFYPVI